MATPHRPSMRLSTDSRPSSFLKQLLDEINGSGTPTASCSSKSLQTSPRSDINREIEECVPSVWVGGSVIAQDMRERLRAANEARLKKMRTFPEEHHELGDKTSRQQRPHLSRLKTQIPAPFPDEVAQSNSALTCSESGLSSATSESEAPTSPLNTSSTSAAVPLSSLDSRSDSPRKREQSLDDTDCQHVSKKMCSMTLPRIQNLPVTADNEPHLTIGFQDLPHRGNVAYDKVSPETTVARSFMSELNQHQHLGFSSLGYNVVMDDPVSTKVLRATTPERELALQRTPTAPGRPETPETPSFARPLHLFDTSVCMYEDDRGDKWMQDVSIYKSAQCGNRADNSLCEHCFRQRSLFSRLVVYGYELCGREQRLNDHYWEPAVSPGC